MYWKNKGKKPLSVLLAAVLLACLFPVVYAEAPDTDEPVENVTSLVSNAQNEVTEWDEPTEEPTEEPTQEPPAEPTAEPTQEPPAEPTPEPTEEPTPEPTEETTPEPVPEPTQESFTYEEEVTPDPGSVWDPSEEKDEPGEDDEEPVEEEEDEELFEFDDDDNGSVSEELLEQFNNPDTYEHFEFSGTADIELKQAKFAYGDTVTLVARVRDVNMSYRLVWEATDDDERGWHTIASGSEYSFVVTPENIDREYRIVLFTVD